MANIQSISRGYKTSSYESVFKPATGKTFAAGDLVKLINADTIDTATLADAEDAPVYVVLEGNDTYSGNITSRVVVLSGIFETTVMAYNTGSYTVNAPLTAISGKFSVNAGAKKTIAHVLSFSLSQGLKVRYHV
jgi:hypothetical protein